MKIFMRKEGWKMRILLRCRILTLIYIQINCKSRVKIFYYNLVSQRSLNTIIHRKCKTKHQLIQMLSVKLIHFKIMQNLRIRSWMVVKVKISHRFLTLMSTLISSVLKIQYLIKKLNHFQCHRSLNTNLSMNLLILIYKMQVLKR